MVIARTPEQSQALLVHETRWHYGTVPYSLAGQAIAPGQNHMADGCFLLRSASGWGYFYAPGAGITVERGADADPDEEALWLNGSVHAAVACLNGFLPLHASAVAHEGRAIAFTGPGGAGKSTLAAGLGRLGLPLFCDDTLLIDLANLNHAICLPGHKRLKLRGDAFALSGASAEEPVGADTGKHYARSLAGDFPKPLPLGWLVFLEEGPDPDWRPVTGAERFVRLEDDHHTQGLFLAAARPDRAALFALRAALAAKVNMARLIRPRSAEGYGASLALVGRQLGITELAR